MIVSDCHMHTSFSSDSDTPMEDMIKAAIRKNLSVICFTEHMDYNFPQQYELSFVFDQNVYFDTIHKLINKYSQYITILKGVEIGLAPDTKKLYDNLLDNYDWDFVIGSTHIVDNIDPYYSEYWDGASEHDCIERYFNTIYDNITYYNRFDSIGHLDYIIRYSPEKNKNFHLSDYYTIVDKILHFIIDNKIALEINSSGYRSGLNCANPCNDIIQRYMDLGGRLFTIGSDAHSPEYIAGYFDSVHDNLQNLGINEYIIYKNRKPYLYHI